MTNAPLLMCKELTKNYKGDVLALSNVSLTIEKGRIVGLLGPNGSGKTTLIKLIMGLLKPTSGEVLVKGQAIGIESKKAISYLPDRNFLGSNQKVKEIIDYYDDFYDNFDVARAYSMLDTLQINPKRKMKTLSKGTQEKVQLVLVMSRRADLYILDEPIAGVDPAARDFIINTILNNYEKEASIIISTHLIADIENVLDDVIFIKNGIIERFAAVDELKEMEGKSIDNLFREVYRC